MPALTVWLDVLAYTGCKIPAGMVEVTKEGRGLICEYYTTQGSVKQKRMNFVAKKKKKTWAEGRVWEEWKKG